MLGTSDLGFSLLPPHLWNSEDQTKITRDLPLHKIQYNQHLRPEDDQSTDEENDRSSQGSADEYLSQVSESSLDSSPPFQDVVRTSPLHTRPSNSKTISKYYGQQSGQNASPDSLATQAHAPSFAPLMSMRSLVGRNKENVPLSVAQPVLPALQQHAHDVPIRTKPSSTRQNAANSVLQLDTTLIAPDVRRSRMRPQEQPVEIFTNPRRNRSACPKVMPRLRRDTDHTDVIVKMIVTFCTNLINSIWSSSKVSEVPSQAAGPNVLPLQVFITETLRRSKTSYSTLQIALFYLILLKQCLPPSSARQPQGCRAMQCGRRMFLTALILASKYLQDRNYSARAWSKISGLPLKEINENERRYLSIVCWDLHVPRETFENWSKIVLNVCRLSAPEDSVGQQCDASWPPKSGQSGQAIDLEKSPEGVAALRNWWLSTLKCLSTNIVKCPIQTERYCGSIAAFRQTAHIPRPIFDQWKPDLAEAAFAHQVPQHKMLPRLPSMDTISRHFNSGNNDSPASIGKMLGNLPTPQQTPHASDMAAMWTPYVPNHGIRCQNSASILGKLDQPKCPVASLSTCPPPPPKALPKPCLPRYRQSQLSHQSMNAPEASLTSSPESVVSDASAFSSVPRSRSSSISSTTSWATSSTSAASSSGVLLDYGCREPGYQHMIHTQPTNIAGYDEYQTEVDSANRPILTTQYMPPSSPASVHELELSQRSDPKFSLDCSSNKNDYLAQDIPALEARSTQHAQLLEYAELPQQISETNTPRSSRPTLFRSTTQIPCTQTVTTPNPFLKRSRSASNDQHMQKENAISSKEVYTGTKTHVSDVSLSSSYILDGVAKGTVHTTGLSSANRTPVPTTLSQNKRMALQMPR